MKKLLFLLFVATITQAQVLPIESPRAYLDSVDTYSGAGVLFLKHLLFVDATYDIGASGATRPRDFFLSRNATIGGTFGLSGLATLSAGLTLSGTASNITLGSNYISNGGTDAGLSFDASNNATLSAALTLGSPLVTTYGGTGLSSWTGGDVPYYASGTTLSKLAVGGANKILGLNATNTAPEYKGVTATLAGAVAGVTTLGTSNTITTNITGASSTQSAISGAIRTIASALTSVTIIGGNFTANQYASSGSGNIAIALSANAFQNDAATLSRLSGIDVAWGASSGGATNGYGLFLQDNDLGGTIGTNYGIYVDDVTSGSTNYALYTKAGSVQLGTLTASRLVASDASKNLVSTITSANAALSVSDETGTGKWVFNSGTDFDGTTTGDTLNFTGPGTFGGLVRSTNPGWGFDAVPSSGNAVSSIRRPASTDLALLAYSTASTDKWYEGLLDNTDNYIIRWAPTSADKFTLTSTGSLTVTGDIATDAQISEVNNVATEGNFGVPAIVDTVVNGASSASIGATNLTGTAVAGFYRVNVYVEVGTAEGLDNVGVILTWSNGGFTSTVTSIGSLTAGSSASISVPIYHSAAAGSSIQYSTNYSNGGGGTATYTIHVEAERLN